MATAMESLSSFNLGEMLRRFVRQRYLFVWLLGLVSLLASLPFLILDDATAYALFQEGRLVENATVVAYGLTIILLLWWCRASISFRIHAMILVTILILRELDLHRAFTSEGITRPIYYTHGTDPLEWRIVAGLILLVCIALACAFLMRLWRARDAIKAGIPHALTTLVVVVLLPLSKAIDSSVGQIKKILGLTVAKEFQDWMTVAEESIELAVPVLMILAISQFNYVEIPSKRRDLSLVPS
jgi:hypothetical protein